MATEGPTDQAPGDDRFWQRIPLRQMTSEQWESLCDGCGKCCLFKLEDEETGQLHYTDVACRLLDLQTSRCQHYADRAQWVPDCVTLTMETLSNPDWLPSSCAYRRLVEGRELPPWHPLITGNADSVAGSGNSILGRVISESKAENLEHHLVEWVD